MIKTYIIVAQTTDGKIARNSSHEADWTSRADKKHFITNKRNRNDNDDYYN